MPLGIDPKVDFAFKLMLGSPEHPSVTIHFLNSVLRLEAPIVSVIILNPLVGKDRSEDKLIVLDILARDSLGRLFNIEMQTRLPLSFPRRLLYYNCRNYVRHWLNSMAMLQVEPILSRSSARVCAWERVYSKRTLIVQSHTRTRSSCYISQRRTTSSDLNIALHDLREISSRVRLTQ